LTRAVEQLWAVSVSMSALKYLAGLGITPPHQPEQCCGVSINTEDQLSDQYARDQENIIDKLAAEIDDEIYAEQSDDEYILDEIVDDEEEDIFVSSVAHSVSSSASPDYQDHCQLSSMISHAILVTDTINNNDTATDTINNDDKREIHNEADDVMPDDQQNTIMNLIQTEKFDDNNDDVTSDYDTMDTSIIDDDLVSPATEDSFLVSMVSHQLPLQAPPDLINTSYSSSFTCHTCIKVDDEVYDSITLLSHCTDSFLDTGLGEEITELEEYTTEEVMDEYCTEEFTTDHLDTIMEVSEMCDMTESEMIEELDDINYYADADDTIEEEEEEIITEESEVENYPVTEETDTELNNVEQSVAELTTDDHESGEMTDDRVDSPPSIFTSTEVIQEQFESDQMTITEEDVEAYLAQLTDDPEDSGYSVSLVSHCVQCCDPCVTWHTSSVSHMVTGLVENNDHISTISHGQQYRGYDDPTENHCVVDVQELLSLGEHHEEPTCEEIEESMQEDSIVEVERCVEDDAQEQIFEDFSGVVKTEEIIEEQTVLLCGEEETEEEALVSMITHQILDNSGQYQDHEEAQFTTSMQCHMQNISDEIRDEEEETSFTEPLVSMTTHQLMDNSGLYQDQSEPQFITTLQSHMTEDTEETEKNEDRQLPLITEEVCQETAASDEQEPAIQSYKLQLTRIQELQKLVEDELEEFETQRKTKVNIEEEIFEQETGTQIVNVVNVVAGIEFTTNVHLTQLGENHEDLEKNANEASDKIEANISEESEENHESYEIFSDEDTSEIIASEENPIHASCTLRSDNTVTITSNYVNTPDSFANEDLPEQKNVENSLQIIDEEETETETEDEQTVIENLEEKIEEELIAEEDKKLEVLTLQLRPPSRPPRRSVNIEERIKEQEHSDSFLDDKYNNSDNEGSNEEETKTLKPKQSILKSGKTSNIVTFNPQTLAEKKQSYRIKFKIKLNETSSKKQTSVLRYLFGEKLYTFGEKLFNPQLN